MKAAKEADIGIYWDAVISHKAGADDVEEMQVIEVDAKDRLQEISEEQTIKAWMRFDFPGRKDQYSKLKYHWYHFNGTDYDAGKDRSAVFRVAGEDKHWAEDVDELWGNADFLMFANLDYEHPEVRQDVLNWGSWIVNELGLSGFRLDALRHLSRGFLHEFIETVEKSTDRRLYWVGEFCDHRVDLLSQYLEVTDYKIDLFDFPLQANMCKISKAEDGDLRTVFQDSLVSLHPTNAVTMVENHDLQKGQVLEYTVEGWMKPIAYCLILLRREGYPCVFFGDLYGTKGKAGEEPSCGGKLADLILARKLYAYGDQNDYWDDSHHIGFVRRGTHDKPDGLACVMSNTGDAEVQMHVGTEHAGEVWTDVIGWHQESVIIDEQGHGVFKCNGVSCSVWVRRDAPGRGEFPFNLDDQIYN